MRRTTLVTARAVSASGLAAISAMHLVWATGSAWPAKTAAQLADAVVGQATEVPGPIPTATVAVGAAGASVVASGVLGTGRTQRLALSAIGTALVFRAILGGDAALAALGLPPSSTTFRRLDRRFYRPLAGLLGTAMWVASDGSHKTCG